MLTKSKAKDLWAQRAELVSSGTAAYTDVVIDHALNATIWDVDGKEYVDFAGGIGTINVGHCHPKVVAALREQAGKLLHTSFHVAAYPQYMAVCRKLVDLIPGPGKKKVLLLNSGSEAVENAVKFARAYTKRQAVVSFGNAFHGRTLLCLTLDGKYKPLKKGLGPFAPEVYHAPMSLEALENFFVTEVSADDIAAFIIEPVQGEGGFLPVAPEFLKGLRALADKHGIVLIIDEVQTGFGRTGKFWAMEHAGIAPDLVTIGKSLAAGMPLSAVAGKAEIMDAVATGAVGGTYGGNPMSCAAALAVFDIFQEENLVAKAVKIGETVRKRFDALLKLPIVGDSRGLGAMRAIELVSDKKTRKPLDAAKVKQIIHRCQDDGLIVIKAGPFDNVIRTLMPLTIGEKELNRGLDIIEGALQE